MTINRIKFAYLRNEYVDKFGDFSFDEGANRLSIIICDNRADRCDTLVRGRASSSSRDVGGFYREIENYANIISDIVQSAPKKRRRDDVRSCVCHYRKTAARCSK